MLQSNMDIIKIVLILKKTEHIGFYVDWTGDKCLRKDLGYWIDMVYAMPVGNIFDNKELLQEESDE